jgi:hypothetical protein
LKEGMPILVNFNTRKHWEELKRCKVKHVNPTSLCVDTGDGRAPDVRTWRLSSMVGVYLYVDVKRCVLDGCIDKCPTCQPLAWRYDHAEDRPATCD